MADASETLTGRAQDSAAPYAMFFDFDGTLVEIAERPDLVAVDPLLAETMARLRDRLGGALAVISGRPIEAIDDFLAPHRFDVAGLHGAEHRRAGEFSRCRPDDYPELRRAVGHLRRRFGDLPGILVEDKGCSVAVHWRLAPYAAAAAYAEAETVARTLGSTYRLQRGKAVAEIMPATAAKGSIIASFLEHAPYRGRRPVFIGDDVTDEHGFEAVNTRGGISIRVGSGATAALRVLESPADLRRCLIDWAAGAAIDTEWMAR